MIRNLIAHLTGKSITDAYAAVVAEHVALTAEMDVRADDGEAWIRRYKR